MQPFSLETAYLVSKQQTGSPDVDMLCLPSHCANVMHASNVITSMVYYGLFLCSCLVTVIILSSDRFSAGRLADGTLPAVPVRLSIRVAYSWHLSDEASPLLHPPCLVSLL